MKHTSQNSNSHSKYWIVLIASSVLEAVWATSLSLSEGFTQLTPTIVFGITLTLSMLGLGYAMREIPISVSYAVWTGLGAALTVTISIVMGNESVTLLKILFLSGIVGCVIGLRFAKVPDSGSTSTETLTAG